MKTVSIHKLWLNEEWRTLPHVQDVSQSSENRFGVSWKSRRIIYAAHQ